MLAALLALPLAAGPLLGGAEGVRVLAALQSTFTAGLAVWLSARVLLGHLPLPSRRLLIWAAALATAGAAAAFSSPAGARALPGLASLLLALALFPALAELSKDERGLVDQALRLSGWLCAALALYQRFALGRADAAGPFDDPAVWCAALVMLAAPAYERGDRLLLCALALCGLVAGGLGAWWGLAAALWLTRGWRPVFWGRAAAVAAVVCLVVVYNRLGGLDLIERARVWRGAAAMLADRPLLGVGPGSFGVLLARYAPGAAAADARMHPLQAAAEWGLPAALLWFAGLWHCLRGGPSPKRFAALAVLLQSLWDPVFSVPSNLWLFSYLAASSIPETSEGANVPWRMRPALLAAAAAFGLLLAAPGALLRARAERLEKLAWTGAAPGWGSLLEGDAR